MAIIWWETTDRRGRIVRLSDAGWFHICARHRDMWDAQDEIRRAVERADEITRDLTYRHREINYRQYEPGRLWMRVVVHYRPTELQGWVGDIITAHFTGKRIAGEVLLWPSQN